MMLSLDTAYRSFGGEVEASSTPTICRLSDSRRHQLRAIAHHANRDASAVCQIQSPRHNVSGIGFGECRFVFPARDEYINSRPAARNVSKKLTVVLDRPPVEGSI